MPENKKVLGNIAEAKKIEATLNERYSRYGTFEDNANITQELMEIIERSPNFHKFTKQHKEAIHMIFHKISRMACGDPFYIDNVHDIVGYAKLLEDCLIALQPSPIDEL